MYDRTIPLSLSIKTRHMANHSLTNNETFFPLVTIDVDHWPLDSTATVIPAERLPQPYRQLLAHTVHMTETVEAFYRDAVDVHVLGSGYHGPIYFRQILLTLRQTGRIVQYGFVRINLPCCSPAVRDEITRERTPLGRILVQHNVLRRIEPTSFLKVEPGPSFTKLMHIPNQPALYGRTGVIFCDNQPAISVMEILSPIES